MSDTIHIEKYLDVTINVEKSAIDQYNSDGKDLLKEIRRGIASCLTREDIANLRQKDNLSSEELADLNILEKKFGEKHVTS